MNWSKYYMSVDERGSVLTAVVGEKIVVRGSVFHSQKITVNGRDVNSPGVPVVDQPQISCDIHPQETWNSKVETKQFTPDVQGNFEFEIDTASYAPGTYFLWVFYADGENPDTITRRNLTFLVFSQQEVDELRDFLENEFLKK